MNPKLQAETTYMRTQEDIEDSWKHRSQGMRCKTCIWFVKKEKRSDRPYPQESIDLGRCRRHAPTMNGYPVVFVSDWCGDHRIDENKL
jgi:hypothetical protein